MRPRWLLGPSLWVGGVLMWSYVVMGIFTTTRLGPKHLPLGEGAAIFWVLVLSSAAGHFAVRRSLTATSGGVALRTATIALGALSLWLLLLVSAILAGQVAGDGPVSLLLSLGSAAIVWRGRILTNRGSSNLEEPRLLRTACWIGAALVTAVALLVR
jgi:hypothetical protein